MKARSLYTRIWQELATDKEMVFLAGPRQTGKTTLARIISGNFPNTLYWNWDIPADRARLLENPAFFEEVVRKDNSIPFIIFDEIHKYRDWKNYLKGVYDGYREQYRFLVTGSGRLDMYQKGGDSLAGRYLPFHLWPFTIAELAEANRSMEEFLRDPLYVTMERTGELQIIWSQMEEVSGFPEPFLINRPASYRRWSQTYAGQIIREDIRDLTDVKSVANMETLYALLPSRTGSSLSVTSLAETLHCSYNAVRSWLDIFERFFLVFSIPAWTDKVARAIQKERKYYLWDVPRIKDPGVRFENMVAIELWRAVTCWNNRGLGSFSLHFVRNKEKEEVDFLVANEHHPLFLIEAKLSESRPSKTLLKFQRMLGIPAIQLIREDDTFRLLSNDGLPILIAPAPQWLSLLP
ncbi:MAG: ATP-binding protein [Proteobacteria bacterium]|nr:ATP-binding protein [Pseudomonadota bacterium]